MIHVVLIAYQNSDRTETRWKRDVLPGLEKQGMRHVVTCVDNSPECSRNLQELFGDDYLWQGGQNLMYGPSLNLAVPRHPSDFILYVCTQHGRMQDPTWVYDMLRPMLLEPKVGMTGCLTGSNSPEGVAYAGGPGCEWVKEKYRFDDGVMPHVQGGVFAARTELMLAHPYPDQFPHLYTDHLITWEIMKAGYKVYNIPTICSVWRQNAEHPGRYKYVHDEAHV